VLLSIRANLAVVFFAGLLTAPAFASHVHRSPTAGTRRRTHHLATHRSHRVRGQQSIEPERATQIQQALIREHYLSGEPTGNWDAATIAAMQKYQADNGWQTRLMPDSRALKKLGLGPDYSTAINAKNSTFAAPPPISTIPADQAAGFASAAGVSQ
jgi:peptidoglycan hydrolase-like protein with peptidoglycan-binding domain